MDDQRKKLIANGWRQGIILPSSAFTDVPSLPETNAFLMAISQTCDLLQPDFKKEPFATFLVIRNTDSPKPEASNGHHPRTLQFFDTSGTLFEGQAWEQIPVPHDALLEIDGSSGSEISEQTRQMIANWLAKRFDRIAFPDGFVSLLDRTKKKTKKALKRHHHLFSEILLSVSPFRELNEGEKYRVVCVLLMEDLLYSDKESKNDANEFSIGFEKLISVDKIEVVSCEVVSEAELTVAELRELVRLDYDFLSFRDADTNTPT